MNEWSFICANGGEGSASEVFFVQMVLNHSWQVWVSLKGKTKVAESKMAEFKKMAAIHKLSENE